MATSLSLLGNHMFPDHCVAVESEVNTSVNTEEPAEPPMSNVPAGPVSIQVTETEESGELVCQNSTYTQPPEGAPEEAGVDNGRDDSGEFVVTILTRSQLEEQGVGVKGKSSPLSETSTPEAPAFLSHREEDVTAESWRQHRKHVFVLSEAGKPIYSRYGSEEALSSTMGVMMALVSFVQSGDNIIRSVYSGESSVRNKWFINLPFSPSKSRA